MTTGLSPPVVRHSNVTSFTVTVPFSMSAIPPPLDGPDHCSRHASEYAVYPARRQPDRTRATFGQEYSNSGGSLGRFCSKHRGIYSYRGSIEGRTFRLSPGVSERARKLSVSPVEWISGRSVTSGAMTPKQLKRAREKLHLGPVEMARAMVTDNHLIKRHECFRFVLVELVDKICCDLVLILCQGEVNS